MLGLNDVPTLTPSTDNVATLNAERAYRLAEWGATGDGNPDLGGPGEVEQVNAASSTTAYSGGGWDVNANPDGSYTVTSLQGTADGETNIVVYQCGVAGNVYQQTNYGIYGFDSVDLLGSSGSVVAQKTFSRESASDHSVVLNSVDFSAGAGDFKSDMMNFVPGTTTVSSFKAVNADGSSVSYAPQLTAGWEETFYNSAGARTEDISSNLVSGDPSTGTAEYDTVVTTEAGSTVYPSGDPSAPGVQAPPVAPGTFAAASSLWSSILGEFSAASASMINDFTTAPIAPARTDVMPLSAGGSEAFLKASMSQHLQMPGHLFAT